MEKIEVTLQKALRAMSQKFTSNQFGRMARKAADEDNYYQVDKYIRRGGAGIFLLNSGVKKIGHKIYQKQNQNTAPGTQLAFQQEENLAEIEKAIKLLKSHGYQIFKPITQFIEV